MASSEVLAVVCVDASEQADHAFECEYIHKTKRLYTVKDKECFGRLITRACYDVEFLCKANA